MSFDTYLQFSEDELKKTLEEHTNSDGYTTGIMKVFKFVKQFKGVGDRGKVGLLEKDGKKYVYKMALDLDHSISHEYNILRQLSGVRKWCPHFNEMIGMYKCPIYFSDDRDEDPFTNNKGSEVYLDTLLLEYISGSITFNNQFEKLPSKNVFSLIRQVLLGIEIMNNCLGIVHYDLHTDNILLKSCPRNSLFLYNLKDPKGNEYRVCVPTYGVFPILIDYGFSYVKGSTSPMYFSMNHTESGYLACLFEPRYDARIFLLVLADDMSKMDNDLYKYLVKKIKNIYSKIDYNPHNGRNAKHGEYSAGDFLMYTISEIEGKDLRSKVFFEDTYDAIHLVQTLIKLPIKNKSNGNIEPFYRKFVDEFIKLEESVKTSFNKMTILRQIVDSARELREQFYSSPEETLKVFRLHFFHHLSQSIKFYNPPNNVDYHILLDNLFKMSDCMETVYFRIMKDLQDTTKEMNKHIPSTMEIYNMIEKNFATEYTLTPESIVYVWDTVNKCRKEKTGFSKEFCADFNRSKNTHRPEMLWKESDFTH